LGFGSDYHLIDSARAAAALSTFRMFEHWTHHVECSTLKLPVAFSLPQMAQIFLYIFDSSLSFANLQARHVR
jgi:hypothetical protein